MYLESANQLWQTIASIAEDEGLKLYDLERINANRLNITIDRLKGVAPSVEGEAVSGVTSEDCSRLCRRLMVFFQAEGPAHGLTSEPDLEVSSPGINRILRLPEHFLEAIGSRVKVVTRSEKNGPAGAAELPGYVIGELKSADTDGLLVIDEVSKNEYSLRLGDIKRANVEYHF